MSSTHANLGAHFKAIVGDIRAEVTTPHGRRPEPSETPPAPFVTISRQAGAGGLALAEVLVDRLNALGVSPGRAPAWAAWDRQLVAKVAGEHGIAAADVGELEDTRRPWLVDFLSSLSPLGATDQRHPDELVVYHRLVQTVRALAQAGGAVLVGRGAVFVTRDLPAGVHVRLVAPVDARVASMARRLNVPTAEAARRVRDIDAGRDAFFRRHWPGKSLEPETFTVTFNTAGVTEEQMASSVLSLIPGVAGRLGIPSGKDRPTRAASSGTPAAADDERERMTPATPPSHGTWHAGAVR